MGCVAGCAALDFHRGVFKDKRPALFDVALRAGLPAALAQRSAVRSAMGVVAVRTFHRTFRNPMMRGQSELRLDIAVASVAQFRLRLNELAIVQPAVFFRQFRHIEEVPLRRAQAFGLRVPPGFYQVHRVAAITRDAVLNMR